MSVHRGSISRRKLIEDALRDLAPEVRELARRVLENILIEENSEISDEELKRRIEELKKKLKSM